MRSFLFSLLGGLLIGGASVLLLVGLGRIAGISGITFGLLERANWQAGPGWRLAFVAGLVGAGWLWQQGTGAPLAPTREMHLPLLVISGLLVAVLTFMGTGAVTVFVMRHVAGAGY